MLVQVMEFILLQIIQVPMILTFAIGGHLFGFSWKGQRFKRTRAPLNANTEAHPA